MRKGWVVLAVLVGVAGCGGPSVGTVLELKKDAMFYADEKLFRQDAEVRRAGGRTTTRFEDFGEERCDLLGRGSKVRTLALDSDGYKVQLDAPLKVSYDFLPGQPKKPPTVDTKLENKVGWILRADLDSKP